MNNAALRTLLGVLVALSTTAVVHAQAGTDAPADEGAADVAGPAGTDEEVAAEPEPEVAEPEPEVAEPEPEVAEPEPEVAAPATTRTSSEGAGGLGRAEERTERTVEDDLEAAEREASGEDTAATPRRRRGGGEGGGEGDDELDVGDSTADRLATANPTFGVPWSMPTFASISMTLRTLDEDGQLSYNPNVGTFLSVRPRWNFSPALSVGYRQDLSVQLTQGELTHTTRELQFGDARFDVTYMLPFRPGGLMFIPSAQVRLPASKFSRVANRRLGLGPQLIVMRANPLLGGFITGFQFNYIGWIANGTNPRYSDDAFGTERSIYGDGSGDACRGLTSAGGQELGKCNVGFQDALNARHAVVLAAFATLIPFNGFQVNASFAAIPAVNPGVREDVCFDPDDVTGAMGVHCVGEDNSRDHVNWTTSFAVSVGYDVQSWLTVTLGYSTTSIHPRPRGTQDNVFWNELSNISLGLQFRPSALYSQIQSDNAEEENGDEDGEEDEDDRSEQNIQ